MIFIKQFLLLKLIGLITFLFVFPFLLQSQTYESEKVFRDQQDSVFALIFTNPSSAKEKINLLISKEDQMADSTKGLTYSLNGIYYNTIGENNKAISNLQKAAKFLKNNPHRLAKVRLNIGTSLRNNGDYDASIKEFERILDYYKKQKDSLNYANILGEIGANYNLTLNHEKAVDYFTKGIGIFERNDFKADLDFAVILQRLANSYYKQSKFEYANELYLKSLELFKETNQMQNYNLTLINLAESLNWLKKRDSALTTINESIEGIKVFKNKNLIAIASSVKAVVLSDLNQTKKASEFYAIAYKNATESNSDRLVPIARDYIVNLVKLEEYETAQSVYEETEPLLKNTNLEYQYSFLLESARYFSSINNNKKAFKLSILSHKLKDSSFYGNKQELVDELQTRFRVQEQERTNAQLKLEVLNKEKNISILTLSTIVAVFILLFIIVISRFRSSHKNKVIATEKENNSELTKKLDIEQENLELKEKLIEHQKSELLGYSMEVSNMNEKIELLIRKFEENDISSSLSSQLKSLITVNKSWDSFIERFKEVDPDFIPRLSKAYPTLTQKDLEFCSLVRINISYKDIGNFLQISHESVFKKKYRISKKMKLNSDVDFQNYIIQF